MPYDIVTRNVVFSSGKDTVQSYLALPEQKGSFPGLVVIHEWWGLNDWVKGQSDALAKQGYVALAVDLYRGRATADPMEAHELSRALPEDRALRDLKAGFDYLRRLPQTRGKKLGVVGWCMGGSWALTLALHEPRLSACVIYYGRLLTDQSALKRITCPILGIFGDSDRGIPVEMVRAFESELKRLHKRVEIHIFAGAGHAFANPNNQRGYNRQAAERAWQITLNFLQRTLGS
ncbi:MAG: dienelactone hydrolase family protein [Armatimonadota bacterium]|nr:dienelactone hydrolase family protein [bacterium]MDW8322309.1 dienelactone hydrolase family protein [Armatimonadota bacterium]